MRAAIRSVLDSVAPQGPVDIVALSLSGQYAVMEALVTPVRVRRLVLIGPTGVGRYPAKREGAWGHAVERWLQLPLIGDAIFGALSSRRSIDWYLDRTVEDPRSIPEATREAAHHTARQPGARWAPASFIAGLLDVPGIDEAYAGLAVPTLMLFGEEPRFSDPEAMTTAMAGVASVTVDRIADTRDLPHWERPERTVGRIVRFLDEPAASETTAGDAGART
jgi:pimeloyl-ACP methyl ester carboxylesterase